MDLARIAACIWVFRTQSVIIITLLLLAQCTDMKRINNRCLPIRKNFGGNSLKPHDGLSLTDPAFPTVLSSVCSFSTFDQLSPPANCRNISFFFVLSFGNLPRLRTKKIPSHQYMHVKYIIRIIWCSQFPSFSETKNKQQSISAIFSIFVGTQTIYFDPWTLN